MPSVEKPHHTPHAASHPPHLGGKIEFRMSSVCVVSFSGFFAPFFPLAPPVVLTKMGVLYFTNDAEF